MAGLASTRGKYTGLFVLPSRPTNRSECKDGPRPCPFVGCRYHLASDEHGITKLQRARTARVFEEGLELAVLGVRRGKPTAQRKRRRTPSRFLVRYRESCALDVADRGEHSTNEIAELTGLWHTNAESALHSALEKLSHVPGLRAHLEARR